MSKIDEIIVKRALNSKASIVFPKGTSENDIRKTIHDRQEEKNKEKALKNKG